MPFRILEIVARKYDITISRTRTHSFLLRNGHLVGFLYKFKDGNHMIKTREMSTVISSYTSEQELDLIFSKLKSDYKNNLESLSAYLMYVLGISSYTVRNTVMTLTTLLGLKLKIWSNKDGLTVRCRNRTKYFSLVEFERYLERNLKYFI